MRTQCVCGWLRASDLATCGHYACAAHALGWGELVLRRDDFDGWRHYLQGEPVHCGAGLLLLRAGLEDHDATSALRNPAWSMIRFNGEPCALASVANVAGVNDAREAVLRVRYESPLATMPEGKEPPALLYCDAHGHEALIRAHSGMRFRWPHRG